MCEWSNDLSMVQAFNYTNYWKSIKWKFRTKKIKGGQRVLHSNEVPAFYLTHYTTMFDTVMSGSVCYLRIISKGIPTPCVKRQRSVRLGPLECIVKLPWCLKISPPLPHFQASKCISMGSKLTLPLPLPLDTRCGHPLKFRICHIVRFAWKCTKPVLNRGEAWWCMLNLTFVTSYYCWFIRYNDTG